MLPAKGSPFFSVTRKLYSTVCWITIILCLSAYVRKIFGVEQIQAQQEMFQHYNSRAVCDDAWETEIHHENDNINQFTVKMREGCFSGFIYFPKSWTNTRITAQMADSDPTKYWIAVWQTGRDPDGPFSYNDHGDFRDNLTIFRVQGNGTVRFFVNKPSPTPVRNSGNSEGLDNTAPAKPVKHIAPTSGGLDDVSIALDRCVRSGEEINCDVFFTDKSDAALNIHVQVFTIIDDEGNTYNTRYFASTNHIIPDVPLKVTLKVNDPHMKAKSGAFIMEADSGGLCQEITFKGIPIE